MKLKYVIGLMSGTSMDGINASLVKTNGEILEQTDYQLILNYNKSTASLLKEYVFNYPKLKDNKYLENQLSNEIVSDHNNAITEIIKLSGIKPDLVGFHGQTVFHNPKNKISVQIGDGYLLSRMCKIKVVSKFRQNDINNGGEGAPISPIYHKFLMQKFNIDLPCSFINIGGVSNITYWDGHTLIGFDLGPGNGLMDVYCQKHLGIPFDNLGEIASQGQPDFNIINNFLKLPFFKKKYPKSIDRLEFESFVQKLPLKNFSHSDILSTFLEFTVVSIQKGIGMLPSLPNKFVIMGGGQHNKHLMKKLKLSLPAEIVEPNQIGIDGDYVEADMIAYLAMRRLANMPTTYPNTTGVDGPCIGGEIFNFLN